MKSSRGDDKTNLSQVKNHKSYFRRKTQNGDGRDVTVGRNDSKDGKVINVTILEDSKETNEDENSLDYGLLTFSAAGEGREDLTRTSTKDIKKDESKKTLSDQIAEGKYGLIEKELFSKPPKAPGIISYKTNPETPNDNEKTLGGLSKDEIWLAEDGLLILKGGIANDKKNNENEHDWEPIDDYEAPKRPVKIPLNPRVPPPFPVQFKENGPIQFIGANQFSLFNPYTNETGLFTNVDGHIAPYVSSSSGDNTKNSPTGLGAIKNSSKNSLHDVVPSPWNFNSNHQDDLLKHFPFNLPLPDQSLNRTEDFDEDDPSLFYPPPYSFVYKSNYTNLAPVGPLVPGIILPPPPDFFSVYDPEEENKPIKTPLDAYKRIKEIQLKNRLSASTPAPSPAPKSTTNGYIRDFTRKTKIPSSSISTTTVTPTKLYKTKLTTTVRPSTVLYTTTAVPELSKFKTHHYDTTTLRLHPIYVPTTKLYLPTFSTTTQAPSTSTLQPQSSPVAPIKQYQKDYGTQAHPIYFEYFDARTANPFVGTGYEYNSPSSTTSQPQNQQQKVNKKPKHFYPPQFISSTFSSANIDAKYLFVTQKPDIFNSQQAYPTSTESPSYNTAIPIQKPLVLKPVYDDEIAAIKQTLDYYKSETKKQKPQKVKAVYEFSFEASKHKNHDEFRPMVGYSQIKPLDTKYSHYEELIKTNSYFPTTTEGSMKYYRTKQSATLPTKKNIDGSPMMYGQKLRQQQSLNYHIRPIFKEVVTSPQKSQPQRLIAYPSNAHEPQSVQNGYRINSKNVKYRNQQSQPQQQYYGPASEVASLLNDTLVNYKQPQRPINPFSENIDVSRYPQNRPSIQNSPPSFYPQQSYPQHSFYHPPPPQSSYQVYHHQRPIQQQQSQQSQHYQQQQNPFDYPLISQINPDSVHITFYNRPMEKSDERF